MSSTANSDAAATAALDTTPTKVILPADARPGLRACGAYLVGTVYTVPKHEADRLIAVKGFRLAKAADEKPVKPAADAPAATPATTTDKD